MSYPAENLAQASIAKMPPKKARSTLVSRNITISGHRTSVRLEPEMWSGLSDICRRERANMNEVCSVIASNKPENSSLTAAIRVFVMAYFRAATTEEGHGRAGHGRGAAQLGRPVPAMAAPTSSTPNSYNPNLIGTAVTLNSTAMNNPAKNNPNMIGNSAPATQPQPQPRPVPFMIGARFNNR